MTETPLLIIAACLITLFIWLLKSQIVKRQMTPLNKQAELGVRLLLTFLLAFGIHIYLFPGTMSNHVLGFWSAVVANCLILYAVTHISDRVILRG